MHLCLEFGGAGGGQAALAQVLQPEVVEIPASAVLELIPVEQAAVERIEKSLSQGITDRDVGRGDLQDINKTIGELTAEQKTNVIASLSDDQLQTWGNEIDGFRGGLSDAEQVELFTDLGRDLDSIQLSRVYNSFGSELVEKVHNKAISTTAVPDGLSEEEQELYLDLGQLSLDVVGIFDPTPIADGTNTVISLFRGKWLDAGLSAASMVPYIGDLAKAGKLGSWAKTVENVISLAAKNPKFAEAVEPVLKKISDGIEAMPPVLPDGVQETLGAVKSQIDDFSTGALKNTAKSIAKQVDDFVTLEARNFIGWKADLAEAGFSKGEISEIVYQGSLKRGENIFGKGADWKRYLEEITGTKYPGPPSHAHHLVEKVGRGPFSAKNREILSEVGINPLLARENLTWAPNVKGQHGIGPQRELMEKLEKVRGDRDAIIEVLNDWATIAQSR